MTIFAKKILRPLETAVYLIPVTLGDTAIEQVLPSYNKVVILQIRHFIVENIRSARRFLKKVDASIQIDELTFYELNHHVPQELIASYLDPIAQGCPVGIISEAGCPAVADPGADVVAIAQRRHLKVVPLVGPSSIIMSVMASGFNGQSFAFHGYLPLDESERTARIKQLEARVYAEDQTQLFIETPYRNGRMMMDLLRSLRQQTRICVAADITCADEHIVTQSVGEWRKLLPANASDEVLARLIARVPTIFLIYK